MATWPATTHELIELQHALGELTPQPWQPPATLSRIGACFVCFEPVQGAGAAGDRGFAGAAVTHGRRLLAGVAVSGLVEGRWPADQRGASVPLLVGGEVVGCWVRTRAGARPVAVHAAWQTDTQASVQVVPAATRRARTPEPRVMRPVRPGSRSGYELGRP